MAKSLIEWLGKFVEAELEAVLAWDTAYRRDPHVKREASRFDDDGSNFRSIIESPPLTSEHKLQLLQVLSLRNPVSVLLSDGHHSVKALLSQEARDALQAELGDNLDLEMTGDVFSPTTVTVVSTPFGAVDGHLQLYIEGVQYHYHLRRTWGSPKPIHEHQPLAHLLKRIKDIRAIQFADQFDDDDDVDCERPSQAAHTQASVTPTLNQRIATQAHIRRKPTGPSLVDDGLEIEKGDNLAMPVVAPIQSRGVKRKQATVSTTNGAQLLNLLGRKDGHAEKARIVVAPEAPPSAQPVTNIATPAAQETSSSGVEVPNPHTSPVQDARRTTGGSSKASSQTRILYGRRPIPPNQHRLLDRKESWFPALPGWTHPHPNVPIDLLNVWSARMTSRSKEARQSTQAGAHVPASTPSRPATQVTNVDDSSMDTSSDEELPESQWPASQTTTKRNVLPPDSTIGSRPSAQSAMGTPRKLPYRSPDEPHPASAKPTPTKRSIERDPASQRSSQQTPMRHALPVKPPPALDSTALATVESTQYPSSSEVDLEPVVTSPASALSCAPAPAVQGTQYPSSSEVDMEPSVPRALDDPTSRHRQERSKFMKQAQRQTWVEQNCKSSQANVPYINDLIKAYNSVFTNDDISRTDMRTILEAVFPKLGTEGYLSVRIKPKISPNPRPAGQQLTRPGRGLFRQQYDGAADNADDAVSASMSGSTKRLQRGQTGDDGDERSPSSQPGSLGRPRHIGSVHSPAHLSGSSYRPRYGDGTDNSDDQSRSYEREHNKVRMSPTKSADDADDAVTGAPAEVEPTVATGRRSAMTKTIGSEVIKAEGSDVYDEDEFTNDEMMRNGVKHQRAKPSSTAHPAGGRKMVTEGSVRSTPAPRGHGRGEGERSSHEHTDGIQEVARTPFQEFMLAYNSVRPGGVFAVRKQKQHRARKDLGRVDVLAWKL
ncbi:hypothetical protein LTR78_005258 [Recurvomyces mirabilis]|uniref:Shelterin complex subunit TPP1/Est3 domain-containing protein n=1 Tax=Recurvomyces mirabilis TaxID=574656 RepID=A0AAE0WNL5_9PEZI|nr:hypothetical protein LTR78_005258 [Recurvomyces mirabilis]KAK5157808.1 hypothetical protein LTS14_003730 [Recurvomyces mirabilis]